MNIGVAEAKRRFSELLAKAAYRRERFIIERRGKPVAALIGLEDLARLEDGRGKTTPEPKGLLALVGAFANSEDFDRIMASVYKARRRSRGRPISLD